VVAAIAICAFGHLARADDPPPNPRAVFGFKPTTNEAALDCSDGRDFGCAQATDDLADDSVPFSLSTWLPAKY
jgi:hypothetical protein